MDPNDPRLIEGLRLLNERRYYEAHEVLEDLWMAKAGEDKLFVQAIIQADIALYHRDNGNSAGAAKLFAHAREKLAKLRARTLGGLSVDALAVQIEPLLAEAHALASDPRRLPDPELTLTLPVDPTLPRPAYTIDERGEVHFAPKGEPQE